MTLREQLARIFIVHKCSSCGHILDAEHFDDALCEDCYSAYKSAKIVGCPNCFMAAFECTCQPRMMSGEGSLCLRKLFFYRAGREDLPQNRLVYFFKHKRSHRVTSFLASELWSSLEDELCEAGVTDVASSVLSVSIPRGRRAQIRDGFDQSELFCYELERISGIRYLPVLRRRLGGKEQKKLTAAQRKRNIKDLIYADDRLAAAVRGKYVVLFDDVVTTGASMSICLAKLRKMGARGVFCCCVAYDLKNKTTR